MQFHLQTSWKVGKKQILRDTNNAVLMSISLKISPLKKCELPKQHRKRLIIEVWTIMFLPSWQNRHVVSLLKFTPSPTASQWVRRVRDDNVCRTDSWWWGAENSSAYIPPSWFSIPASAPTTSPPSHNTHVRTTLCTIKKTKRVYYSVEK